MKHAEVKKGLWTTPKGDEDENAGWRVARPLKTCHYGKMDEKGLQKNWVTKSGSRFTFFIVKDKNEGVN